MRDMLFKNLTSPDRKKKVIVSSELVDKSGIRTRITRRLICLVREVSPQGIIKQSPPYLYVLKERNHKEGTQRFFCRMKGSIYTGGNNHLYLITFVHSLKINMKALSEEPVL